MVYFRLLLMFLAALMIVPATQAVAADQQYKLASGDTIKIHVFGEDDLNMEVRLDSTGAINYPFLGKVRVTGLTVSGLESKLINGLRDGYLINPQVNVSIVEHRSFYVEGEVKNPGGYPYKPGLTVRKAISLAGGYTEFAAKDRFKIRYDKSPDAQVDTVSADAQVGPGDSVTVDKSIFYIDGEVEKPGSYPFQPGLTLREAVSLAGGLTERASESNIVIVSKDGTQGRAEKTGMGTKIRSGDSIRIKQSFF